MNGPNYYYDRLFNWALFVSGYIHECSDKIVEINPTVVALTSKTGFRNVECTVIVITNELLISDRRSRTAVTVELTCKRQTTLPAFIHQS